MALFFRIKRIKNLPYKLFIQDYFLSQIFLIFATQNYINNSLLLSPFFFPDLYRDFIYIIYMYTTENKPAKRFDYNAYIQARLDGKYVVAYIEEDVQKKSITQDIIDSIEPFADISFDTIVSKEEKGTSETGVTDAGSNGFSGYPELITYKVPVNFEAIILCNIPFKQVPTINCRGAPLCHSSEALKS